MPRNSVDRCPEHLGDLRAARADPAALRSGNGPQVINDVIPRLDRRSRRPVLHSARPDLTRREGRSSSYLRNDCLDLNSVHSLLHPQAVCGDWTTE